MKRISADWRAIEVALHPHQIRTLRGYASSKGLEGDDHWVDPVVATVAMSLAVDNALAGVKREDGRVDRRALLHAATRFNFDVPEEGVVRGNGCAP